MSTIRVSTTEYRCGMGGAHVWIGDPQYIEGESHFSAPNPDPACVVEPGTPEDVGKIVRLSSASPDIALRSH